jgi:hypothetical protein
MYLLKSFDQWFDWSWMPTLLIELHIGIYVIYLTYFISNMPSTWLTFIKKVTFTYYGVKFLTIFYTSTLRNNFERYTKKYIREWIFLLYERLTHIISWSKMFLQTDSAYNVLLFTLMRFSLLLFVTQFTILSTALYHFTFWTFCA